MHEGIYIAASAGTKQGRKMEVIANNLANVNSTGYKKDRLAFKALMTPFQSSKGSEPTKSLLLQPDKSNSNVSYVAVSEQYTDHESGTIKQTNSELDMALDGPGYFSVSTEEGIRYTRNGNFRLNSEKQIVNQ
jgi:flagellar basal-body rod protein FlgG